MKKTRLIPIVIVFIMIINCLLPVLPVKAATNKAIILNGELYNAVKEELNNYKITASYNDSQRRIVISEAELLKVTKMDLSNSELSNISGLENFANLTSLDLSGNELTSESNLDVLSGLKLEFLDLSSNKIEDVSMISNFNEISEINLHSQVISTVDVISLDTTADSDHKARVTIKLPQILSLEKVDSDWLEIGFQDNPALKPIWQTLSRDENNVPILDFSVASFNGENYEIHDGALEITVTIGNTGTELEDTTMSLFYVVIDQDQRAALFKDDNFYKVVKKQLTQGENAENIEGNDINPDLRTYYKVSEDEDGNTVIEGKNGENLYQKAYDKAKVMVFDFNTLINEIPTLEVSNSKVRDISGLETFVGLDDYLNLSYNYIDSIDKIIELQENKLMETKKLQEKYTKQINEVVKPIRENLIKNLKEIEKKDDEIEKENNKIAAAESDIASGNLTEDQIKEKLQIIDKCILKIEGGFDENGEPVVGLINERKVFVNKANEWLAKLIPQMDELYKIYNKEYKASTLLTVELYDMTATEFLFLSKADAEAALVAQISKIQELEEIKGISEFELDLISEKLSKKGFGTISLVDEKGKEFDCPITEHLVKLIEENKEVWGPNDYKDVIEAIIEADVENQLLYNYTSLYLNYKYENYNNITKDEIIEIMKQAISDFTEDIGNNVAYHYVETADKIIEEYLNDTTFNNYRDFIIWAAYGNDVTDVNNTDGPKNVMGLSQILGLSGKFVHLSEEEIARWITLPDLEKLNLQNNMIEEIDGIENLTELEELNVSENELVVINNIDWSKLTKLTYLDLHFNFISDITSIANAINLESLNVANNLLSGEFNFDIANLEYLTEADFSLNAYTDIYDLIEQYKLIAKDAKMNVNDYIMKVVDIKLHNQNISIDLDEKILIGSGDSQIIREVELPKIIKQFEELDSKRTIFGTQSIYGKISADGKVGLIISNEIGNHSGLVTVDTKDYSEGLSVGHGTTCKINYTVTSATVNDVLITMDRENAIRGGKTQFEAHVDAVNVWDTTVTWTVDGKTSNDTRIDENGLLTIGEDETAEKLTVRATSNYDNSKYLDMKVNVVDAEVKVTVKTTANSNGIVAGASKVYEAEVITEADNKEVSWSVSGNTSENTVINREGLLKVGKDEAQGAKLTIRATSDYNTEVSDYVVEVVVVEQGSTPIVPNPGNTTQDPVKPEIPGDIDINYEVKDEYIYASKPGMTIEEFVTGLSDGEHTITVSDGEGNRITDYTGKVSREMVICIDDLVEHTYEIIVTGDVNNDGKVNTIDSNLIKEHRVETSKLEGLALEAADINKDGKVNKIDSFLLLYFRADKIQDFAAATIEEVMK